MFNPDDDKFLAGQGARLGRSRGASPLAEIAGQVNWLIFLGFIVAMAITLYACNISQFAGVATFLFVLVGWFFSLTLHEFSHAATAFLSGDRSYSTRRYLSGNPLNYIHPVLSILLPLLFVVMGGIGLPGGAVYLQRGLIRSPGRRAAISAAGPAANLVCLLLLAALDQFGSATHLLTIEAQAAVAFLAFLQGTAVLLNLIPIPGLDGYGVIEPYLSYQLRQTFEAVRPYGFIIIFLLFWTVPVFNQAFFGLVERVLAVAQFDPLLWQIGYFDFRFWAR
ncbi:MAG TPA: site-2 protease family protein [Ktedonobacterales bacterium]|nr:site-2 protease family protein [Ktedonobacterales bacterium]